MERPLLLASAIALAVFAMVPSPGWAAGSKAPARGTEVRPVNKLEGVDLEVSVNRLGEPSRASGSRNTSEFKLGDKLEVCFKATTDGYVTVWSDDLIDVPAKIFPNRYSGTQGSAQRVSGGQDVCVGSHPDFALVVSEPVGTARINVIWTRTLDDQVGEDEFIVTRSSKRKTPVSRSGNAAKYASQSFDYDIIKGK